MSACKVLLPIFSYFVSTLDSTSPLLDSNFNTSPEPSLAEGGPSCRVSTCFYTVITSQKFINRAPCRDFVKKHASMCSVLQYEIDMFLLSIRSFTKEYRTLIFLEFLMKKFLLLFSIFIELWLSWNKMLDLMPYTCSHMNKQIQIL